MGILKNFIERYKNNKVQFKEAKLTNEIHHKLEEREKNANERELERYYEEERQRNIQQQLVYFRKKRTDEILNTNVFSNNKNLFNGGNCFAGHKSIMNNGFRGGIGRW